LVPPTSILQRRRLPAADCCPLGQRHPKGNERIGGAPSGPAMCGAAGDADGTGLQWFDRQMPSVELVRSSALTDTIPYAYAAITPPGRLVFTAGACPLDHDGAVLSPGGVAAQAQQVMANLAVAVTGSELARS
jgi:enamine deaminase RidA (YjgF/YER057c/UK114 family)